jgi:DNA-binding GntR family transcriptional regulator
VLSLTEKAYRELEERIVTLVLEPGEVLSEARLSRSLGIGRTPVREALQRLAREGLVLVLPRRGVLVSEFNVQSHLRMLEVRRELENLMARCAAARSSDVERGRFRELGQEMRQAASAGDDLGFMRLDLEFNQRVASASRNEFAVKALALMAGLSRRFWFMHNRRSEDLRATADAHARVAGAIAAADPPGARRESDRLMDHIEAITRAAVDW